MGGRDVARASSLWLRTGDEPTDGAVAVTPPWDAPPPETLLDQLDDSSFDVVTPEGRSWGAAGRRQVWVRDRRQLVAGIDSSPFVRAALVADIASPLANFAETGLDYINADLTLHLGRLPVGEWIGAETTIRVAADGVAYAACTLHDLEGPIGSSTVCAVRNPRMPPVGS